MQYLNLKLSGSNISEEDLIQIFDIMPSGLLIINTNGVIVKVNSFAKKILANCNIDTNLLEQSIWSEIFNKVFYKKNNNNEYSLINKKNIKIDFSPLKDSKGQLVLLTDLTQTINLQKQVSHLNKLSALGNMMASLAHQIKTPLSSAILYGSNLANNSLSENKRIKFQQKLIDRLKDLQNQVDEMLNFAKNEENMEFNSEKIADFIDKLKITSEDICFKNKINLDFIIDNDLDSNKTININKINLISALGNLIENACQASNKNQNIQVFIKQEFEYIEFCITDFGVGISTEKQKIVFDAFYSTKENGTGLGLAFVKNIVNKHHGYTDLNSQVNNGSCFTVGIPVK